MSVLTQPSGVASTAKSGCPTAFTILPQKSAKTMPGTVDIPALDAVVEGLIVNRVAENVEYSSKGSPSNGDADGLSRVGDGSAAAKTVGGGHGDTANDVVTDMLSHLNGELFVAILHGQRIVYGGTRTLLKAHVNYRSHDLRDASFCCI